MKNKTINISIIICLFIIIIIKPLRIYGYETFSNITNDYSNIIAVNIENASGNYESSTDIPTSGYVLNTSNSFCGISNGDGTYTRDTSVTMNYHDGVMFFGNMSVRKTKCFLYFDMIPTFSISEMIASYTLDTTRSSGSFTAVFTDDTSGKIFLGPADDYGSTTYFFAGANPNNWVYFAGYYWRIIRVNGDGTLRLIYNGSDVTTTGTGTHLEYSAFNSSYQDNAYVGYMYGTPGSNNYNDTHANTNNSTIKGVLDTWYSSNLTNFASYIDTNVGFCGDRQPSTSSSSLNGSGGTGTTYTYYGAYIRLYSTKRFTYKCAVSSDLYTVSGSSYGNKALKFPIGLITMDEVAFAGGFNASNTSYWLNSGVYYWTITPSYYNGNNSMANVYVLSSSGTVTKAYVGTKGGARPVINLKSDTIFSSGDGTSTNPFIVK